MKFYHSIRWRIQIWQSLLLAVVVVACGFFFYQHEKKTMLAKIDSELQSKLPLLFPRVSHHGKLGAEPHHLEREHGSPRLRLRGSSRPPKRRGGHDMNSADHNPIGDVSELNEAFSKEALYYAVWANNDAEPLLSENAPIGVSFIAGLKMHGGSQVRTHNGNREAFDATPSVKCIIVGMKLEDIDDRLGALAKQITLACSFVIISAWFIGWILTGVVTKPFIRIRQTANKIAKGDLQARIEEVPNTGETGELAHSLNETFDQLEKSFEIQQQFTADASHELRGPIAALLMQVQMANRKRRSLEEYVKLFKGCERNTLHLKRLADELLDLSALDAGMAPLNKKKIPLNDIFEDALSSIAPLVNEREATVSSEKDEIVIDADQAQISRVLCNLLTNALIHSPLGVSVKLRAEQVDGNSQICIEDDGPGIPSDQLDTIFDRFRRGAKSRAQVTNSTGLGLAITQSIIQAHEGTIKISSKLGQGTQVLITLPYARID